MTIPNDWSPNDYILLEPQTHLNKPYDERHPDKRQADFAKAANEHNAFMHMEISNWTRKIITPGAKGVSEDAAIVRICDVPVFRPYTRDPSLNRCHTIAKDDLPDGVWEDTHNRPWSPESFYVPRQQARVAAQPGWIRNL